MSMWGGRFDAAPNALVAKMGESISYDRRLYKHDIRGSKAHAQMLARQKIIPESDAQAIVSGLDQIQNEIESSEFEWSEALEDVHMNIEDRLTKLIGPSGARLHAGRSRNDQVATDFRLYLRDEVDVLRAYVVDVQRALVKLAVQHTKTVLPGFTHLQHAQPIVLAHYLLAYTEMFQRDVLRLDDWRKRMNYLPLGSSALAGSTLPLDRNWVAEKLGFDGLCENSLDAVSDRDFAIELVSVCSMLMMHLSRISEDIIFWMSQEAGWVELGDDFCTGSSLMPQKKNPDMCELTRGKTARVYGNLTTLLTIMKGIPLAYNRDMQEDKEPVFDALDTVKLVLSVYAPMIQSMKVNKDRMYDAASDPALMATDLAEWLVKQGMPFRDSHHRVGKLVGYSRKIGVALDNLTLEQMQSVIPEANEECLELWKPERSVALRDLPGGTAPAQALHQLKTKWAHLLEE
ncbi:Argininosuccinate lyase [Gracilariopsis chorda]|uniref:Argininosuccinate lyase n=1 Tax=Gracilariopsis chorda TaxID=448386 RepID=A0A2V3J0P4_9FLOR|nr:Argininosuccinate lyase [Gracilariopsis chorda]|eukprot:PXF47971.1 Argininosuccinate lyase [Gracilariopsis chorda]